MPKLFIQDEKVLKKRIIKDIMLGLSFEFIRLKYIRSITMHHPHISHGLKYINEVYFKWKKQHKSNPLPTESIIECGIDEMEYGTKDFSDIKWKDLGKSEKAFYKQYNNLIR